MKSYALLLVSKLVVLTVVLSGCGAPEGPDGDVVAIQQGLTSQNAADEFGLVSLTGDDTTDSNATTPQSNQLGGDATVEDHNGRRCTFDCPNPCVQASRVAWGQCENAARILGCRNARWCRPGVCCS